MHTITRRAALAMPAVAAFAPTAYTEELQTAAAPELPDVNCENPELLRLSGKLSAMTDRFERSTNWLTIMRTWGPRWPKTPEALIGQGNEIDRDLAGHGIMVRNRYGEEQDQHIATVENLQFGIGQARRVLKGRSIDSRRINRMDRAGWEQELTAMLRLEAKSGPTRGRARAHSRTVQIPVGGQGMVGNEGCHSRPDHRHHGRDGENLTRCPHPGPHLWRNGAPSFISGASPVNGVKSLARSVLGPKNKAFVIAVA